MQKTMRYTEDGYKATRHGVRDLDAAAAVQKRITEAQREQRAVRVAELVQCARAKGSLAADKLTTAARLNAEAAQLQKEQHDLEAEAEALSKLCR